MEAAIAEIKPNITKAFISNLISVGVIVVLIIGVLVFLNEVVGLEIFLEAFGELGVTISAASLLYWSISLILFFTLLLLILNYINLGKVSYTLYPDKIVYSKIFFMTQLSEKIIPYPNITKITYEDKSLLKTSKIILELTGVKKSRMELDFIDNAEEIVKQIHDLITKYRANYYAKYSQDYRFQHIIDKY